MDLGYGDGTIVIQPAACDRVLLPVGVGGVTVGDLCILKANLMVKAGNGETFWGMALETKSAGEWCTFLVRGIVRLRAAAAQNFAPGDPVYIESTTTISTGAAGERSLGYVVNNDPAAAEQVDVYLTSAFGASMVHPT